MRWAVSEQKATMLKITTRHDCREEIADIDKPEYYIGSVAQCSCGQQFIKSDSQRDGIYWKELLPASRIK